MAMQDLLVFGMMLFALAAGLIIASEAIYWISSQPLVNQTFTSPDGNTTIKPAEFGMSFVQKFDWIFIFAFVILTIGMFMTGWLIPSHPIFIFVSILGILFWLLVAPMISNSFLTMIQLSVLADVVSYFPLTAALMMNLPIIGAVVGTIAGILTHGKTAGNPYAKGGY